MFLPRATAAKGQQDHDQHACWEGLDGDGLFLIRIIAATSWGSCFWGLISLADLLFSVMLGVGGCFAVQFLKALDALCWNDDLEFAALPHHVHDAVEDCEFN